MFVQPVSLSELSPPLPNHEAAVSQYIGRPNQSPWAQLSDGIADKYILPIYPCAIDRNTSTASPLVEVSSI